MNEASAKKNDDRTKTSTSKESAYDNLKRKFDEECRNHKEAQNLVKFLEDKVENAEDNFNEKLKKLKTEKEALTTKINDYNRKQIEKNPVVETVIM